MATGSNLAKSRRPCGSTLTVVESSGSAPRDGRESPGRLRSVRPGPLPSEADLRAFLAGRLPAHMSPASITFLERLPRLPNAKVDLNGAAGALLATRRAAGPTYAAPRNEIEAAVGGNLAGGVGLDRVGVCDNFFELGGDSIRSIQMVARAARPDYGSRPSSSFRIRRSQTYLRSSIRLAACKPSKDPVGDRRRCRRSSMIFRLDLADPQHFNQSVLLTVRPGVTPEIVDAAARWLPAHDERLCGRYARSAHGAWHQEGLTLEDLLPEEPPFVERVNLSSLNDTAVPVAGQQGAAMERAAAQAQAGLCLDRGPLVRMVYFNLGAGSPARLLIVIHHLLVDAVSWRILIEDLSMACGQLVRGETVSLPPKTTSFAAWGQRLTTFANLPTLREELNYWTSPALASGRLATIPCDNAAGENTVASTGTVRVCLDADATRQWLFDSHAAYRTRPHELLVTALAETLCNHVESDAIGMELEGHGREDLGDDVDLSRTVGWFTSLYPVALRRPAAARPGEWIKSVKEQLRSVPRGGIGYGMLRWLAGDVEIRQRLAEVGRPDVSFNYLGQFDHVLPEDAPFSLAGEGTGPERSSRGHRPHVWEIIAHVRDGQLHVEWRFSNNLHRANSSRGWPRSILPRSVGWSSTACRPAPEGPRRPIFRWRASIRTIWTGFRPS